MVKASRKRQNGSKATTFNNERPGKKLGNPALKVTPLLLIIIILLVSFAVYFNALFNDFVYDDITQVSENPWIRDVKYIPTIFSKSVWSFQTGLVISNYYRPVMHLIYMLNYHLFGLKPWGFHLVNILFHAGVSVLVFLVVSELLRGSKVSASPKYLFPPFIASMLFATHPIHTEAVTWIAGLPDISFSFFYLLSFYLYIRSRAGLRGGYIFSAVSFSFATFSKEPALTLPIVLMAYDYLFRKAGDRPFESLKRYVPYFVIGGVYLILRIQALGGFAPQKRHIELTAYQYVINVFPLFIQYFEKLILPLNLNAFYVFHPIYSLLEPKGVLSLILTAAILALGIIAYRKNKPALIGLLFIIIPLLPVLYIPALGENTFTERYLYMPSLGFVILPALLLVWAGEKFPRGATFFTVLPLVFALVYSLGTVSRNTIWKDDYALFTDTAKKSPDSLMPYIFLGNADLKKGWIDKAIEHYQSALKLRPDFALVHYNLGNAYIKKGWNDKAIERYEAAVRLKPDYSEGHNNLGNAYLIKGLTDKAIEHFQVALRLKPENAKAHCSLGIAYLNQGLIDRAIELFQTSLKLEPDLAEAHYGLGNAYMMQGLTDKAIECFQAALRFKPNYAEASKSLINAYVEKGSIDKTTELAQTSSGQKPEDPGVRYGRGNAYFEKGWNDKAIEQYQAALRLKPDFAEAHYSLGNVCIKKGWVDKGIEQYKIALRLKPDFAEAHYTLGNAYYNTGWNDKAIEQYQAALRLKPDFADAHYNLGISYGKKGLKGDAIRELKTALEIRPTFTEARQALVSIINR